jgi:error-prone DNA polymerase
MSMLPRLQPREFYDLVIEVAIVRPGPIQGNMVHPYLRRRAGEEEATYPNDEIREVLHKTMGVPIFQEQAMRLAVVAAGFTPDEADQLRRAMGAWRKTGVIEKFRRKLIDGMLERGLTQEYAEQVFQQISGFGEYGFPESHSASFALLVYVSAWLKCHYPAASCAAVINSQPMGFYAPAQLVRDARQHGVEVRTVDVNESENDCTLEAGVGEAGVGSRESGSRGRRALCSPAPGPRSPFPASPTPESRLPTPVLRLGFCLVSGLTKAAIAAILAARPSGRFRSLPDLARRARLTQPSLVRLAKAQAFGSLGIDRRGALWTALAQKTEKPRPLFDTLDNDAGESRPTALPALDPFDEVLIDYHTAGLSLRGHPMQFLRHELQAMRVVRCADLATIKNNRLVRVAGLVLVRQRPGTARGITFVTIEDETGVANLVVRPDIWQRFRRAANSAAAMLVLGRLERKAFADIRQPSSHEPTPPQQVIHVLVSKIEDLAPLTQRIRPQSRDFH